MNAGQFDSQSSVHGALLPPVIIRASYGAFFDVPGQVPLSQLPLRPGASSSGNTGARSGIPCPSAHASDGQRRGRDTPRQPLPRCWLFPGSRLQRREASRSDGIPPATSLAHHCGSSIWMLLLSFRTHDTRTQADISPRAMNKAWPGQRGGENSITSSDGHTRGPCSYTSSCI